MSVKKLGRPIGAKQNEYEFIEEVPAVCRVCGSKKLTVIDGYPPMTTEGGGMRPDGRIFTRIERRWKICECGQRYIVTAYIPPAKEKLPTVDKHPKQDVADADD